MMNGALTGNGGCKVTKLSEKLAHKAGPGQKTRFSNSSFVHFMRMNAYVPRCTSTQYSDHYSYEIFRNFV